MYTLPSIADFKTYFLRDFPFNVDPNPTTDLNFVQDADIQKAFDQASVVLNQGLFATQAFFNIGFMLLAAHWLVFDLRASSQGIAGKFSWSVQSHSVGSVSESFGIPQTILENPQWAMYAQTYYGAKYLVLILPGLYGRVMVVGGATTP